MQVPNEWLIAPGAWAFGIGLTPDDALGQSAALALGTEAIATNLMITTAINA